MRQESSKDLTPRLNVSHIDVSFITDDIIPIGFFGIIFQIKKGGVTVDIPRSSSNPVSTTGEVEDQLRWMKLCGGFGSSMEHAVLEIMYGIEAVSTIKIFQEAHTAGVDLHVISKDTLEADLAQVSANSVVKNHIRLYLTHETRTFEALIPQRSISVGSWVGTGWLIAEPSSGAAGYMICGGLHNDSILNGGSFIDELQNAMYDLYNAISKAETIAYFSVCGLGAAMAVAGKIVAMGELLLATSTPLIATVFAVGFWGVAVILAIGAIMLMVHILQSYTFALLNNRRRKESYVV